MASEDVFLNEQFDAIIGQAPVKRHLKSALLMERHVIVVGPPGVGKTTLAKTIAAALPTITVNKKEKFGGIPITKLYPQLAEARSDEVKIKGEERFVRVQGSPDLTAEDLLGDIDPIKAIKYGPLSVEAFSPGKIFKANQGVLFFDELNRCPEKLQNALLQVLQEGIATIGSYTIDFPANFIFVGTMNPEDYSGTEKLSEVFLDRFDLIYMTYPETTKIEEEIVMKNGTKRNVEFPEQLIHMIVEFVRSLRASKDVEKKPSVRASLGLYERAQANAIIDGRKRVQFKDIKDAMISVLKHRIKLKPSVKYLKEVETFIKAAFDEFLESNPQFSKLAPKSDVEEGYG